MLQHSHIDHNKSEFPGVCHLYAPLKLMVLLQQIRIDDMDILFLHVCFLCVSSQLVQWLMSNHTGLVLSGGGARTAFQVGVLKAISEWIKQDQIPFKVITGASAGSINAAYLAANADQFQFAVKHMNSMWRSLKTRDVYSSEILSINHAKTLLNVFNHIRKGMRDINSILNAMPLARLLHDQIDFEIFFVRGIFSSSGGNFIHREIRIRE